MLPGTARIYVLRTALILTIGGLVGWYYEQPIWGLLLAALVLLGWQVRQLLSFYRALSSDNFDAIPFGEGIWQQVFSRVRFDRERAKRRKADYRKLLREIQKSANAMPDGAVILDAGNEIQSANRAAKSLAGLKRKKDRGQRIDNILRDPHFSRLLAEESADKSVDIPSPVLEGHWLNCRIVPYGAEQKLLILRDITERIVINKMRRDFVANASHELRSPLTVINGYIDALAESGDLSPDWEKPVAQMRHQSMRMRQILDEMLELSRIENSGTASRDEAIDVAALLTSIRDDFERPENAADIVVEADPTRKLLGVSSEIESVVVNLVSNSLRYTPAAGEIRIRWEQSASGADLVVTDNGEGIEPEHLPRLTERFFRVDKGRSRDEGGIGLGLAIVKHVLTRHDAELAISSEPGRGSEFRCHFPEQRIVLQ